MSPIQSTHFTISDPSLLVYSQIVPYATIYSQHQSQQIFISSPPTSLALLLTIVICRSHQL